MQDVGEAWLMTSLTTSPILVALIETAGNLPVVLLALPAGALADVVDRRRLLLFMQCWMCVAAVIMGVVALTGLMTPWLLLLLSFLLGVGSAMSSPAWQAITPDLVPNADLPKAIALSSVGVNIARAIGPAVGGILVAATGPWAVFFLNAMSFLGVMAAIYRWQPARRKSLLPPERIIGAIRVGTRYVRNAPALQIVLVRCGIFISCASALWALLPQQSRHGLGLGSFGYGALLGCLGAGAVAGAWLLPKVRDKVSINQLVAGATAVFALATMTMAYARSFAVLAVALAAGGVAWMAVLSNLNAAAQVVTPAWVRARALAVYLLVFMIGLAGGSAFWGIIAEFAGVSTALLFAGLGLVIGIAATWRYRLVENENLNLTPSMHWPEPVVVIDAEPEEGPVLIQIEYLIDEQQADDFLQAMRVIRQIRLRDGSMLWGLFRDSAVLGRYVESYLVESWVEHLRQHERIIVADREAENRAQSFHIGARPPVITHFIAEQIPE